jgi:hypothetical protein
MRTLTCLAALLMVVGSASAAVTLYAPNGLARPTDGSDDLIMFDSDNPSAYMVVGSMGVPNIGFGGMDFDSDGNLWAYASFYKNTGGAAAGLYRVNTLTGQATLQGTASLQSLQDLAYDPVTDTMYGINTQGTTTTIYSVDLATGATTTRGVVQGLPDDQHAMSLAIDSAGRFYVHDSSSDGIYTGRGLRLSLLYTIPQDTNYSQGMTIDWSRDDMGYHAAVGQGVYPHYFSQLNTFTTDGLAYTLGGDFGPELPDGLPPVECGDVAVMPIPEPASLLLLAASLLIRRR